MSTKPGSIQTDAKIRAAKPDEKPYKIPDSGNIFLLVHSNGSRYWRLRYRFLGKEKTLALGVYPDISLSEARGKRDKARKFRRMFSQSQLLNQP